jgi:hypothetical protein
VATIWVSSSARGAADGTSYDDAYGSISDGLGDLATKGDVLNIVADGTHDWPTSRTTVSIATAPAAGTSYSDPSFTVRGTDTDGNAAMATIAPKDSDGDVPRNMVYFRDYAKYCIIENLIFDATGRPTDTSEYNAVEWRDTTQGPHKTRYCAMLGGTSGTIASGNRFLTSVVNTGSSSDQGVVEYCYFQNTLGNADSFGLEYKYDHCVYVNDSGAARTGILFPYGNILADLPASVAQVTNCTVYDGTTGATQDIFNLVPSTGVNAGTVNVYSNLVWLDTTGAVNPFMGGGATSTSVTHVGTINANVLLGGPNVASGDLTAAGWYELPWDANDDDATDPDTWPSDSVGYGVAAATVFNDPTSTYDWEMPNGLTITILKDLRPIQYKTSGLFGDTPGALPKIADGDVVDDGDANNVPYIDVEPIYAPVLRLEANIRLNTERNRVVEEYLRQDIEDQQWREFTTRRLTLTSGGSLRLRSGIETGAYILMESDVAVQVNAGATEDVYLPAAKQVVALGGEYTILKLSNSTTGTATTLITMVD